MIEFTFFFLVKKKKNGILNPQNCLSHYFGGEVKYYHFLFQVRKESGKSQGILTQIFCTKLEKMYSFQAWEETVNTTRFLLIKLLRLNVSSTIFIIHNSNGKKLHLWKDSVHLNRSGKDLLVNSFTWDINNSKRRNDSKEISTDSLNESDKQQTSLGSVGRAKIFAKEMKGNSSNKLIKWTFKH